MDELENLFHLFDSQKKDLLRLVKICSKPLGPEEVHYFLTSMDKICSHGLKNEKLGYWPFVKEFTHKAGVTYIADMKGCVTGPGKSRAWLLLALSEGTLEFYFTSFIGHPAQRARYYRREAFLRDDRRLRELVLGLAELMAVQFSTVLRPEEYDLDKHVCPPPNASEDGEFVSWVVAPRWPPPSQEPIQWTHTPGSHSRARRSHHSSSGSSPRSSRSSARSRRRRSPAGGRPHGDASKETRRDSDAAPTDSACVTMDSETSAASALSSAVTTPLSESEESRPTAGGSPESARSAASVEFDDSGPSGDSQDMNATLRGGSLCRGQEEEERGEVVGSATPTPAPNTPVISASSPLRPSGIPPQSFASLAEDSPSPIVPVVRPSGNPGTPTGRLAGNPGTPSKFSAENPGTPTGCSDENPDASASQSKDLFVTALSSPVVDRSQSQSEGTRSVAKCQDSAVSAEKGCSASNNADDPQRGVLSGGCENLEDTATDTSVSNESSSATAQQSSPNQYQPNESEDSRLSQSTSASVSETMNTTGFQSCEEAPSKSTEPTPTKEDAAQSRLDGSDPNSSSNTGEPKDRPLSPTADSRRVSSNDAVAVEEAMRRLRTDPPGPARPAGRAAPHLHPSASNTALRPRPAVTRLPQAHSEVSLRRRPPALAPDKRVTWAGTDRETAAVAALLPPELPRGERGVPEGQEDPCRLSSISSLTRVSSQLSVGSSCLSSGSERGPTARPPVRQTRLYEPTALGSAPTSDGQTERDIEQEISQGRRRKRAAHSALVEIDHCKAVQLMVSFFEGDEMAYTGFKVLFGDHHAMRTCLLVLTSYRLLLLRLSTYRRLRRAARRRPRPADPLSQLAPGAEGQMAQIEVETESCPYLQDAAFQYCSIASIKVAFHGQAVALQRPDGSYSRWIWLCDRAETDLLISHITRAFQRCRLRPLVPQVYTSEAHRHQYLREIGYREREAEIQYASLVYFEDFAVPGETPKLSDQLMYKTDAEPRWSVGHFVLWDTDLLVYPSAAAERGGGAPLDRWPLPSMASCRRLTELSRPHQLQLAAPGRWLTLAAPDADTCSRWAATVREIIELNVPSQLPSPRPRCCVLTGRSLYVVEEMAFTRSVAPGFELCPYGHLVQACGSLRDLGAVNADSHGTVHVEFDTAEAAESMGSWRLYFVTLTEQRAFLAALLDTYRKRCKRELTVGQISHHMREVCLSGSRYVRTRWDGLVDT
ncbi:uncharacterized protein LOC122373753 [Amphibalanus amphitrite]|uniref:uncharacterized protein LOC122373753 n=1 Tax=Amphibalanus amphitrite TaxID=1232801 RepID=UPI001C92ACCC|nr:uncharacterized protein LOC122373753 [Amphibalanus amphitrite]